MTVQRSHSVCFKVGLDANSGAGDGSTVAADSKSMSDFFSELEEEMREGFLPPGLMSDYALSTLDPFATAKVCDETTVDGDKLDEKDEVETKKIDGKSWRRTG